MAISDLSPLGIWPCFSAFSGLKELKQSGSAALLRVLLLCAAALAVNGGGREHSTREALEAPWC